MKQLTKMSRLAGQLEKMFNTLNTDLFNGELDTPVITIIPTARAYAHYTPYEAWKSKGEHKHEINIASGTLDRPLEAICASLLHEMVHMYNDTVQNIADCSRGGTYHNKQFAKEAEAHWLHVEKHPTYGYCLTSPTDELLEWLLDHPELREIEMCRKVPGLTAVGVGTRSTQGGTVAPISPGHSHHRRYVCPCCNTIIRATKIVRVICADCGVQFVEM